MKRQKLWIIILSIVAGIVVVFGGGFLLTKLSSVSVEFRSRLGVSETRLKTGILEDVKTSAEFNFNKSVLFIDVDKNIDKIEKANPYIKVNQVIRKFPNKICVYVSERLPVYRIKDTTIAGKWYILDADLKVIDYVDASTLTSRHLETNTIDLEYLSKKLEVGDFIELEDENYLNDIIAGIYGVTRDYFVAKSINFDLTTETFTVTMRQKIGDKYEDGCELKIIGLENLKEKTRQAAACYASDTDPDVDLSKKVIIISNGGEAIMKNKEE